MAQARRLPHAPGMSAILDRIQRELGADLAAALAALPASDLTSLLLEVAARRASARAPAEVLRQYASDRFVRPSAAAPRHLLEVEGAALASLPEGYTALALSPLSPLGTTVAVAPASQNKIVTTLRGTDVLSDASNVLALETALRRRADPSAPAIGLATSARMTRAQALARPEHRAHFQLFVTTLGGRDPGGRAFHRRAVLEAVTVQLALLERLAALGYAIGARRLVLSPDAAHRPIAEPVADALARSHPGVPVTIDAARITAGRYYQGLCFTLWLTHAVTSDELPLGDGGFTDWTAKLTGSRKERFFVGALGTEMLATLFAPLSPRR